VEKASLSPEELAVLLANPAGGSGCGSEAEALRRRVAAADSSADAAAVGRPNPAAPRSRSSLDDWPGPARLAGRLAEVWSGLLRAQVGVSVLHVAAETFGEFLLMSRYPTFLATATDPAGLPVLAVELPLAVVCLAIRRMAGGPWETEQASSQPLTPLEQRLAKRLIVCLVPEAQIACRASEPLEELPLVVHDRLPRVAPAWARTPSAGMQFQVKLGVSSGLVRCCVPWGPGS
jgi:hypothetical protein